MITDAQMSTIRQALDEDGYIGLGILTSNIPQIEHHLDNWVAELRLKFNNKKLALTHGIIKNYGIGPSALMWKARTWVRPFFEKFWKTDDLLSSLDGANYLEYNPRARSKPIDWLHRDQRPENQDFLMIQGVLQLNQFGGLAIVPKSHKIAFPNTRTGKDWYKIPLEFKKNFQIVELESPHKITFWVWDSRCWHANFGPKNPGEIRKACYVTFGPKPENWNQRKQLKRQLLILNGETTSHWPHKLAKNGPPRFYNRDGDYLPADAKGEYSINDI